MKKMDLQVGDVLQLNPDYQDGWGGKLIVVTEPKPWGCQGYVLEYPPHAVTFKGRAYIRPTWDKMEYVGRMTWIELELDDEES